MVSSLSKLHQLDKNGFTHPMLDSWLVKTDADWHRLNACFEITPLLAVDSNASIARLGLVHEYGSKGGVTLYSLAQSDADQQSGGDGVTHLEAVSKNATTQSALSQFLLAKVVAGQTWRAVVIRMTGIKLQSLMPEFWLSPTTERLIYKNQRQHQLFYVQRDINAFTIKKTERFDTSGEELSEFIRKECYPIINEHITQRFDAENQIDTETGVTKRAVLLGRPERLRRYAQLIRKLFKLSPDRLNHLGGSISVRNQKIEVETGCVFEDQDELVFRAPVDRKQGVQVTEQLIVLREHKNGLIEIAFNGPRNALLKHVQYSHQVSEDSQHLITDRVRLDISDANGSLELLSISTTDVRRAYKSLPESESLPYGD
jgi:hypothetical protein